MNARMSSGICRTINAYADSNFSGRALRVSYGTRLTRDYGTPDESAIAV